MNRRNGKSLPTLLSIITVNLNNKSGLERTLSSVEGQTFKDFEFLVIDGGSRDGSVQFLQDRQNPVLRWRSGPDKGEYDAMNCGIRMASGRYVMFLNSGDELFSSTALESFFTGVKQADILYGDVNIVYGKTKIRKSYPEKLDSWFLFNDTVCHQTQIISRRLFTRYGMYDIKTKLVSDYEFLAKMILQHRVSHRHVPQVLVNYEWGGKSAKPENIAYITQKRLEIQKRYFQKETLALLNQMTPVIEELAAIKNSRGYKVIMQLKRLPGMRMLFHAAIGTLNFFRKNILRRNNPFIVKE